MLWAGFSVQTGYGLHMGWAIEGAIGSDLKIDASYLSPNVNLASRLEAATKQYHVRILISEQVHAIMSPSTRVSANARRTTVGWLTPSLPALRHPRQALMRKVDCVTVKGSSRPMVLYTYDIAEDEENMRAAERLDPSLVTGGAPEDEGMVRSSLVEEEEDDDELLQAEKDAFKELDQETRTFRRVSEVFKLKRTTTDEFLEVFGKAREAYFAGEWKDAQRWFHECQRILPNDGPTQTLLQYIERRDCTAPPSWNGVRELTSK